MRGFQHPEGDRGRVMTRSGFTRRDTFAIGGAVLASALGPMARAEESPERHGISAFGDLKYPPAFKHLEYVNPNAPKGGAFSQVAPTRIFNQGLLTFNSLNSFILRGDAAQGMEFTFAGLMARAEDEPDAMYGLAARAVQISPDRLTYRFFMRPGITFHDGSPLTAHDVVFSLQLLKEKGHPIIQHLLHDFVGAQAHDDTAVVLSSRLGPCPRPADVHRVAADFLAAFLFPASIRGDDARAPAGQRPLQGRPRRGRSFYRI